MKVDHVPQGTICQRWTEDRNVILKEKKYCKIQYFMTDSTVK